VISLLFPHFSAGWCDEKETVQFPFRIYEDFESPNNHGVPSCWMGDYRDIVLVMNWTEMPHSGKTCIKVSYSAEGSRKAYWAGIMWQYPANNDGSIDAGLDLTGARKLVFWARGEKGGETLDTVKLGGLIGTYPDSDSASARKIVLSTEWTRYEIDLKGVNLSYISSFFTWVASKYRNPDGLTFYMDEITIEGEEASGKQETSGNP
jgi:hypothetical protein